MPETRLYEVIGPHPVFGHAPGSTFRAAIDPKQAQRLINAGHLQPAAEPDKPTPDKE